VPFGQDGPDSIAYTGTHAGMRIDAGRKFEHRGPQKAPVPWFDVHVSRSQKMASSDPSDSTDFMVSIILGMTFSLRNSLAAPRRTTRSIGACSRSASGTAPKAMSSITF
jgi:hypothetical protein